MADTTSEQSPFAVPQPFVHTSSSPHIPHTNLARPASRTSTVSGWVDPVTVEAERKYVSESTTGAVEVERVVVAMVRSWLKSMLRDLKGKPTRGGALRLPGLRAVSVSRDDSAYFLAEERTSFQEPDSAHMTRPGMLLGDQEEITISRYGRRNTSYRVGMLATVGPIHPRTRATLEIDIGPMHWALQMGPDCEYHACPELISTVRYFRDELSVHFDELIDFNGGASDGDL